MPIPDFQTLMLPLLEALADGRERLVREVTASLADRFKLTDEERQERLPSGEQTVISNRVAWAKTHLKSAGLLDNPTRGRVRLSEAGRQVLGRKPDVVNCRFLKQYPAYLKFIGQGEDAATTAAGPTPPAADEGRKTPLELISVLTLGVDDLERAVQFYRDGLGLTTPGIVGKENEYGAVAFFDLQPGLKLAVWPRRSLSHDSGMALSSPCPTEFTLGHNVASRDEVDAVMQQAKDAGAVVVKPAQDTFWGGYAGYFQDRDGHLWEVVWNPHLIPQD